MSEVIELSDADDFEDTSTLPPAPNPKRMKRSPAHDDEATLHSANASSAGSSDIGFSTAAVPDAASAVSDGTKMKISSKGDVDGESEEEELSYFNMISTLVKNYKDQKKQNKTQQKQNQALTAHNEKLQAAFDSLKARQGSGLSASEHSSLLQRVTDAENSKKTAEDDRDTAMSEWQAAERDKKSAEDRTKKVQGQLDRVKKTVQPLQSQVKEAKLQKAQHSKEMAKAIDEAVAAAQKQWAAQAASASSSSSSSSASSGGFTPETCLMRIVEAIHQFNVNPSYPTTRQIQWFSPSNPCPQTSAHGFHIDLSTPPTPWSPSWAVISDASTTAQLMTLGAITTDATGAITDIQLTVNKSCHYKFGGHDYKVSVVSAPPPTTPVPPAPVAVPSAAPTYPGAPNPGNVSMSTGGDFQGRADSVGHDVLFADLSLHPSHPLPNFFTFDNGWIDQMLSQHDFGQPYHHINVGSKCIKVLAEQFADFSGDNYKYDENLCQLWVKPQLLFNWLTLAKSRGYNCARLLCHGNSKGEYDKFAQDPQVFRLDISQSGAQGNGIYLAAYTAIAKYYNCKDVCGLRKTHYPDGTMILTLLLTQDGAGYGAYSRYRVSGNIPVTQTQSHDDAYSVRDQALILPLGLAVASKSKKRR